MSKTTTQHARFRVTAIKPIRLNGFPGLFVAGVTRGGETVAEFMNMYEFRFRLSKDGRYINTVMRRDFSLSKQARVRGSIIDPWSVHHEE